MVLPSFGRAFDNIAIVWGGLLKRERYTIAVMSSSGRRMKTFSISASSLMLISICLFTVTTLSVTSGSIAIQKYCRMQRDLAADAVQRYEVLEEEVQEIRKSYSDFRNILGIETDEPGDGLGRGGPMMPDLEDASAGEVSTADETAYDNGTTSASILAEATSLKSDLKDLAKSAGTRLAELAKIPSIWPIAVDPGTTPRITSPFGRRKDPFTGELSRHGGIDIASPHNTPIIATADGAIADMGKDRYLGNFVEIQHSEKFSTLYAHLSRFAKGMKEGTEVNRHDVIGYVGMTGRATWYHIHYEVRIHGKRVNPVDFILN
jgi:murein DD-endopeptidase MepM/ murein hydrolase activator NlpD